MRAEMQFRLEQNSPAAGTATPLVKWVVDLSTHACARGGVAGCGARMRDQLTVNDLAHHIVRQIEQIVVSRELASGHGHGNLDADEFIQQVQFSNSYSY